MLCKGAIYFDQCSCLSLFIVRWREGLNIFHECGTLQLAFAVSMRAIDFLVPYFVDFFVQLDSLFIFSFRAFLTRGSPLNKVDVVRDYRYISDIRFTFKPYFEKNIAGVAPFFGTLDHDFMYLVCRASSAWSWVSVKPCTVSM